MSDDNVTSTPEQLSVKPSWFWLKDSKGNASVTATFAFVAFWVTTIAYILSIFEKIGAFQIREFDPMSCSAYLGTAFAVYFGRRYTEAKFSSTDQKGS